MSTFGEKFINFICCNSQPKFPNPYQFQIDIGNPPAKNKIQFESNFVRTSKYTLLSFIPKALILQFRRLANCYFLLIAILLSINIISPLNPLTAWAPLIIVIGISMIRQGYQDFQRYKSDKFLNYKSFARVVRKGNPEGDKIPWSQIIVGDICLVKNQQMFPADLILLSSSLPSGAASIETASLDGEKDLKRRNAFGQTADLNQHSKLQNIRGSFHGTIPDKQLHQFSAKMTLNGKSVMIQGDKQLLYRGTKLKNTDFIYGLVIYTGKNTKIMMNSNSQSIKMSQVETKVNYILGIVLIIQVVLCIIIAIFYGVFRNQVKDSYYYIDWNQYSSPVDSIIMFFTYFVLINTMIPISLIVSIQMVKLFQKYFIDQDKFMYSQWRKLGVNVKSSSLNQQLGQIQYVFSDKTGTLTKNIMEFKIATIANQMFGDLALIAPKGSNQKPSDDPKFIANNLKQLLNTGKGNMNLKSSISIKNSQGQQKIKLKTIKDVANQYFMALSIAHQVVAEHKKPKPQLQQPGAQQEQIEQKRRQLWQKQNKKQQDIKNILKTANTKSKSKLNQSEKAVYQGPSPDQITLVQASREMNYEFVSSTQSSYTVKIQGKQQTFQVLALFPFTSDRKRMSIIIKDQTDGLIKMFTKGADNIIKQRLAVDNTLNLDDQLKRFSVIGLRTLLVGMRVISQKQYNEFKKGIENLPAIGRDKPLQQLQQNIEKNLYLIGATAVLDRLQDEVPQTIRDLIRANIKVWMLTGDKMQTAQNIAKSCNLIQPHFQVLRFTLPKKNRLVKTQINLHKHHQQIHTSQNFNYHEQTLQSYLQGLVKQAQQLTSAGLPKALLIQGSDLTPILATQQNQKNLAKLAENCEAVVCCRLLPIQKANVVSAVRKHLNKITLAIGDGANDVPMIKTAHIGIGLYGQEGMGSVQAADYALPEFRMLWRLLLVHGRWNYIRISEMILYFFYKNMLFTLPQFIAAFFNGYSGQTIFDDIYLTLYNLIFTALPLIVRAVLEQDVNYILKQKNSYQQFPAVAGKSMISQNKQLPDKFKVNKYFFRLFPKIYFIGQQNCIFNYKNYFAWIIEGVLQSTLITTFVFFILSQPSLNSDGVSGDYWLVGLTIYSCIILVVTFKLSTHTRFWSIILFVTIIGFSLGLYVIYMWISNYFLSDNIQGTAYIAWTSIQVYFIVLFCVCVILFVDGLVVFLDFRNGSYASKMRQIVKQEQINNKQYYQQVSVTITSGLTGSVAEQYNQHKL